MVNAIARKPPRLSGPDAPVTVGPSSGTIVPGQASRLTSSSQKDVGRVESFDSANCRLIVWPA